MYDAIDSYLTNDDNFGFFFWDTAIEVAQQLDNARQGGALREDEHMRQLAYELQYVVDAAERSGDRGVMVWDDEQALDWIEENADELRERLLELRDDD